MKVLFDCIVTKDPIHKCSSTIMFIRAVTKMLENTDVFVYWPIPDWVKDTSGLPVHERIVYFTVPQSKDRTREYNVIRPWLEEALSFSGPMWDWDVCVTSRTAQVPFMRVMSLSPRTKGRRTWSKRIILIEEMAILSLKPTVAKSNDDIQDRLTLEGYLAADYVLSPSYHEKGLALELARKHFSPARQKDMRDNIKEACALSTGVLALKAEPYKWSSDSDRKMVLVFAGRLELAAARLEVINGVFTNQFIMNGSRIEPKILSVSAVGSKGEAAFDQNAVEILHLDRDDFWKMALERMDLTMYFHVDGGLLMSIFEPVSFGVPAIVKDAPWSRSVFGDSYPFYAASEATAYGMVNMFLEDYDSMYDLFKKWQAEWFVPEYTRRITEDNLFDLLVQKTLEPQVPEGIDAMKGNAIVKMLVKHGGDDFVIFDVLEKHKEELRGLDVKLRESFDERGLVWSTAWNDFRLGLKHFHGYEDASVKVGHMRKKMPA